MLDSKVLLGADVCRHAVQEAEGKVTDAGQQSAAGCLVSAVMQCKSELQHGGC